MLQKVIYQYTDLSLVIGPYAATSAFSVASPATTTLTIPRGGVAAKTAFTMSCTSASTESYVVIKQPTSDDILSFLTPTVATLPETLPGENIHPAITTAADSTSEGGTTVNGASTGTTVTTHVVSSTIATLGDRVLGNDALAAATVTVTAVSGGSGKTFTISEPISIADDLPLSFSNQKNHQWPLDSIKGIVSGSIVIPDTYVTASTTVAEYEEAVTNFTGTEQERTVIKNQAPALDTKAKKPTVVKGIVTVQPGSVVFDKQQVRAFGGTTLKIGGYGTDQVLNAYGYEVVFSELAVALTSITTTTTAASSNSTSVVLAARDGILNGTSTVSGIGINPAAAAPTVNSGANATGAGTVVLSAAQTLENGTTLTFPGAGKVATVTGYIEVLKVGDASQTLRFDMEKLLTST